MTTPIDRDTLEAEFGPDGLVTLPTGLLEGIQHEPSLHFLRHVGIPSRPNPWFELIEATTEELRTVGDCYDEPGESWTNLPDHAENWLLLGMIPYDDIALDGTTGVIYCLPADQEEVYPLNRDLYAFARFLYLLERERVNWDFESEQESLDAEGATRRLNDQMREIDPEALEVDHSRWHDILEYVAFPEAR
ncbi:SUKH-4 family immunity protein [Streptomyces celluloflavus]|uniref:SUKH-4 family immunity protein n=1 Tax=Streptomyces celluloflavus TaxID=58344 RepID=UPI0036757C79